MRLIPVLLLLSSLAGNPAGAEEAADDVLTRVLETRQLRVCIWPDYYSITYRDPRTHQLSGIDIDLAGALAQDIGPDIKLVFVDSSFASLVDDLHQTRCDIAMFAIGITPQRAEKIRFTQPYLSSDIYAITTRSNRRIKHWGDIDQPGVVVAVSRGTYHEPVMRERLRHARLVALDTPFAREQEVESGRADVFMTDYPYSQRMLQNADWARLLAPPGNFHITYYAYAVKPGNARWHALAEDFVARIKQDGRLHSAAARNGLSPIVVNQ